MANGLTSAVIRRYEGGKWVPYAPTTEAGQIVMPDGLPLTSYLAAREPDCELVSIRHGLDGYPSAQVLLMRYSAGVGGAGVGPAGGENPVECPFRVAYPSRDTLTILATSEVAAPGAVRSLTEIGEREYILTFDEGDYSVYIRVLPISQPGNTVPS